MPVCPKCGKMLSTDQALTYHLQKRNRCGTIKCDFCNRQFKTKLELQMHLLSCDKNKIPELEDLISLYNSLPIVKVDDLNNIIYKSSCIPCYNIEESSKKHIKNNWYLLEN